MKRRAWLLAAGLTVLAISIGPARANIVNGDFATGDSTGWFGVAFPISTPSMALLEVVGEQLHMSTTNTYVYTAGTGWENGDGATSAVAVVQDVAAFSGGVPTASGAPLGTGALQFDAEVEVSGNAPGNTGAYVMVGVNHGGFAESWIATTSNGGMQTYTIDLPGLDVTDPVLGLFLYSFSLLDVSPDPAVATSYTINVDAKLDNFEFIPGGSGVIPEPLTIFGALMGIGGLGVYIRRRTAAAA